MNLNSQGLNLILTNPYGLHITKQSWKSLRISLFFIRCFLLYENFKSYYFHCVLQSESNFIYFSFLFILHSFFPIQWLHFSPKLILCSGLSGIYTSSFKAKELCSYSLTLSKEKWLYNSCGIIFSICDPKLSSPISLFSPFSRHILFWV